MGNNFTDHSFVNGSRRTKSLIQFLMEMKRKPDKFLHIQTSLSCLLRRVKYEWNKNFFYSAYFYYSIILNPSQSLSTTHKPLTDFLFAKTWAIIQKKIYCFSVRSTIFSSHKFLYNYNWHQLVVIPCSEIHTFALLLLSRFFSLSRTETPTCWSQLHIILL